VILTGTFDISVFVSLDVAGYGIIGCVISTERRWQVCEDGVKSLFIQAF
jgi:hypothetical protein